MPAKKKYVTKKRKSFKARRPTVKKLAKKVNQLYRSIETKYWEISGIGALPTNDPSLAVRPYGTVTVGTSDFGTRVGDKLTCKQVRFNTTWELNATAAGRACRIIAFVYKNNPDAIVTPTATIWNLCMESTQANSLNVVNSFRDHDNLKSFAVLKDFSFDLNPTDSAVGTTKHVDFVVNIPPKYQNVQYVSGGTTITRNELLVFFVQDADTQVSVNYVCRFNYTDM